MLKEIQKCKSEKKNLNNIYIDYQNNILDILY